MFSRILIIAITFCAVETKTTCTFDPFCFYYVNGCKLSGCSPFQSIANVTCTECARICERNQSVATNDYDVFGLDDTLFCKSLVYDCETNTCNLFCDDETGRGRLTEDQRSIYLRSSGLCPNLATTAPVAATSCPGQVAKIVQIADYVLPNFNGKVVSISDADGCAVACLTDKLPDGTPFLCRSAQFHHDECRLSAAAANTVTGGWPAEGRLRGDTGARYFQKICLDAGLVKDCPEIFEEAPHKVLVGLNRQTVDARTLEECFSQCLRSQTLFGFQCKSGMFFYEVQTKNCILTQDSRQSRPDLFSDNNVDEVTYFSPNCGADALRRSDAVAKTLPEKRRCRKMV